MSFPSSSLLVPLTFYNLPQASSSPCPPGFLETSYSRSQTRVMKSWGVLANPSSQRVEVEGRRTGGTVIGSKDGTLYVFNQSRPAAAAVEPHRPESQLSRPTSPLFRESRATSRDSSRSASSPPPFNVTSRPRIVSGLNTEQVEAPKNYVDFDDEPDKLKDMLKGRSPRESKETPNGSDVDLKLPPPFFLELPSVSLKRRSIAKPSLSTTNLVSPSIWDRAFFAHDLILRCHILPPHSGPGNGVTSIRLVDHNESLAVLQEMGLVSERNMNEYYSHTFPGTCLFSHYRTGVVWRLSMRNICA
jgi:WD repeat-containing protein 7